MWHLFKGRVYWRLMLRVSFFCHGKIIIVTVWMVLKTKFFFFIILKFKRCIFLIIIGRGMYSREAFVSDYFTLISSINRGRHLIK